tara:strand:+ start:410 stop:589 length:180 start_codon:yes stop_codon:yes gene_type:complete
MPNPKVFQLIKTTCGRAKYSELVSKKGVFARIRLYWFIFFASIKDWKLHNTDQPEESNS